MKVMVLKYPFFIQILKQVAHFLSFRLFYNNNGLPHEIFETAMIKMVSL